MDWPIILLLSLFILIWLLGFFASLVYAVHQIAKRMKPEVHKSWPIGIVYLGLFLAFSPQIVGNDRTTENALVHLGLIFVGAAITWWRYEYWQVGSERLVFGRKPAVRAEEKTSN